LTLAPVLLSATAVTLAVGLNTSLDRIQSSSHLTNTVQARVFSASACGADAGVPQPATGTSSTGQFLTAAQHHTIETTLRAQSTTLHQVAEAGDRRTGQLAATALAWFAPATRGILATPPASARTTTIAGQSICPRMMRR
jgi:hypothetical protein